MVLKFRWKNRNRGFFFTRSGLIGLFILVAMFIAGINYSNTLAYFLCFFILGIMAVSTLATHQNLSGIQLKSVESQPVFAGENIHFKIDFYHSKAARREAVYVVLPVSGGPDVTFGPFSFDPLKTSRIEVYRPAPERGLHTLSGIRMETVFPLGFFKSWRQLDIETSYLVYPRPSGTRSWPEPTTLWFENVEGFHFSGGDDFTGLRPHRTGESQHHIDWKAYARGRPLFVKEFSGGGSYQLWFEWTSLAGMEAEKRLSQLTRWVLEADLQGEEFGLRLPGIEIEPDSSSLHTLMCLRELALFETGK